MIKLFFNHLATELLPDLCNQLQQRGEKVLRYWSAGCASGEEAYTLSLLWSFILQEQFPDIVIDITATDIDPVMIQRARNAKGDATLYYESTQPFRFIYREAFFVIPPLITGVKN